MDLGMAKRRYTAEEIVTVLRQVEVAIGSGKPTPQACREAGITEQTYPRAAERITDARGSKDKSFTAKRFLACFFSRLFEGGPDEHRLGAVA
jgi:hypothetical protein